MQNQNIKYSALRVLVREEIRPEIERLDKKIDDKHNIVMTALDKSSKKLDIIISELPATIHRQDQQEKRIDNLDGRVTILETNIKPT
jgi:hypothetical protein